MSNPRYICVNATIQPAAEARISPLDRGFLFGDGVYEVIAVLGGRLLDASAHWERLERSLADVGIDFPYTIQAMEESMMKLLELEALTEGLVYLQVSRGADASRSFSPSSASRRTPTVVIFVQSTSLTSPAWLDAGAKAVTTPDLRWSLRFVKSTSLLAQVLAKQSAQQAGVQEAVMTEGRRVTEGASSSIFIVTQEGLLVTRQADQDVLDSITRKRLLLFAEQEGVACEIRPFTVDEMMAAREVFACSATTLVQPLVEVDGKGIGDQKPGPVSRALREAYLRWAAGNQEAR